MITEKSKITNKFKLLSDKYHNLSLLFYELSRSLEVYGRDKSLKEFKQHIKDMNLDIEKLKELTKGITILKLNDLKKKNGNKQ